MHIAVAGNIGRKTTLTQMLSQNTISVIPQFEDVLKPISRRLFYMTLRNAGRLTCKCFFLTVVQSVLEIRERQVRKLFRIELSMRMPVFLRLTYTPWACYAILIIGSRLFNLMEKLVAAPADLYWIYLRSISNLVNRSINVAGIMKTRSVITSAVNER
jgi:isopentenyl diphosphate isomerase/L-lactate dehydrogenase-like FMN-dependent dehydrogenase